MAWINAVYDRTQEDVNNETNKGFLNEADWSRILNNYNELKTKFDNFFNSKDTSTQKPDIEEEDIPETPILRYYIKNTDLNTLCSGINKMYQLLKKNIEEYILLPEDYKGGIESNGLYIDDINNIEKDLELIYLNIDSVLDLAERADIATSFGGGDGSINNPYLITSCSEYAYLCELSKSNSFEGVYFKITKYLNFNKKYIQDNSIQLSPYSTFPFKGNLDGQSYTIRNLYYYRISFVERIAIIGYTEGATIKNFNSYEDSFQNYPENYLGLGATLINKSQSTIIDNCKIYNPTISYGGAGFIYEATSSTITNCLVQKCSMYNNAVGSGSAGFIVYSNNCNISNCKVIEFNTSDQQNGTQYAGGFISISENTNIINCQAESINIKGNIQASSNYTTYNRSGGFIGKCIGGTISKCYCQGTVSGHENIGGFIGEANNITIDQCYAYCDVYGVTGNLTGFIGSINTYPINITNSYARGSVNRHTPSNISPLTIYLSGFLPDITEKNNKADYCYTAINYFYDDPESVSSKTTIYGIGKAPSNAIRTYVSGTQYYDSELNKAPDQVEGELGYARTTLQMKDKSTFFTFDFEKIWNIDENINDGYPYLRAV